jgi:hypothetical protein
MEILSKHRRLPKKLKQESWLQKKVFQKKETLELINWINLITFGIIR